MWFVRWMTRNWCDTDEAGNVGPGPLVVSVPPEQVLAKIESAVGRLRGWRIESKDAAKGTVHATRTTKLCRFVDDIHLRLEATPAGTTVHARSKSRVGIGDWGQNERNLRELFHAIVST